MEQRLQYAGEAVIPPDVVRSGVRLVEWPTVAVALAVYGGWGLLTWHYHEMPAWLFVALAALIGCWHGSLQHEVLHGHPTGRRWLNELFAGPPIGLWLPYPIYRDSHVEHHRVAMLTCPYGDPESYYLSADAWARLATTPWGRLWQRVLLLNNTMLGRFVIGPAIVLGRFYRSELGRLVRDARELRRGAPGVWIAHALLVAPVLWWVLVVCEIPLWLYILGFVYAGLGLTMMRSFYEHRPAERAGARTVINEAGWPGRLLYLNNSFHALHHERPELAWYELPSIYRRERERLLAGNDGFLHPGYAWLFMRFAFRPKDSPCHPFVARRVAEGEPVRGA